MSTMSTGRRKRAIPLKLKVEYITLPKGRVVPYEEVITQLQKGQVSFVDGLSRATASSASRRLSRKLGEEVKQSVYYTAGMKGYIFYKARGYKGVKRK